MAGAGRYLVYVTNDSAGTTNPAIQTHFISTNGATADQVLAQIIAFTQYQLCAAGTRIEKIEYSVAPTGGTLPLTFPDTAYLLLSTPDPTLNPMTDWGVVFGAGNLAVLGSGGVVIKRTTTPGRSGRGRLTTPWISQLQVDAAGALGTTTRTTILDGLNCYFKARDVGTRSVTIEDINPYLKSSTGSHLITEWTMTRRLGRLRSRTA